MIPDGLGVAPEPATQTPPPSASQNEPGNDAGSEPRRSLLAVGAALVLASLLCLSARHIVRTDTRILTGVTSGAPKQGTLYTVPMPPFNISFFLAQQVLSVGIREQEGGPVCQLAQTDATRITTTMHPYTFDTRGRLLVHADTTGKASLEIEFRKVTVPRVQIAILLLLPGLLCITLAFQGHLRFACAALTRLRQTLRTRTPRRSLGMTALCFALLLALISLVAWTQNRGIDNDGSHSLFWLLDPREYPTMLLYTWGMSKVYALLDRNVVLLRQITVAIYVCVFAASASIYLATRKNTREARIASGPVILFTLAAVVLAYINKKTVFSNNDAAHLGAVLGLAAFHVLGDRPASRTWVRILASLALGGTGAIIFSGRPQGAALFLAGSCLCLLAGRRLRTALGSWVLAAAGLALGLTALSLPFGPENVLRSIRISLGALPAAGYRMGDTLALAKRVVADVTIVLLITAGCYAFSLLAVGQIQRMGRGARAAAQTLFLAVAIAISGLLAGQNSWHMFFGLPPGSMDYREGVPFFILLVWLGLDLCCALATRAAIISRAQACEYVFLAALPFALPLGSKDAPLSSALNFAYPWMLLMARCAVSSRSVPWSLSGTKALSPLLCILVGLSLWDGYITHPRDNNVPLWEIGSPPPDSFKGGPLLLPRYLSDASRYIDTRLRDCTDYQTGDIVLGIYDIPEILYLIGANAKQFVIIRPYLAESTVHIWELADARFDKPFLLVTEPLDPILSRGLRERGVRFPEDYLLIGQTSSFWNGVDPISIQVYSTRSRLRRGCTPVPGETDRERGESSRSLGQQNRAGSIKNALPTMSGRS